MANGVFCEREGSSMAMFTADVVLVALQGLLRCSETPPHLGSSFRLSDRSNCT